jgi:hypothetical protein
MPEAILISRAAFGYARFRGTAKSRCAVFADIHERRLIVGLQHRTVGGGSNFLHDNKL